MRYLIEDPHFFMMSFQEIQENPEKCREFAGSVSKKRGVLRKLDACGSAVNGTILAQHQSNHIAWSAGGWPRLGLSRSEEETSKSIRTVNLPEMEKRK